MLLEEEKLAMQHVTGCPLGPDSDTDKMWFGDESQWFDWASFQNFYI